MGSHVIILGGGAAGLAAASRIAEAGHPVTLIERKPFLGGRIYSVQDRKTGETIDNGQHVLMGCYHETFTLLRRLGTMDGIKIQDRLQIHYKGGEGLDDELSCLPLPAPFHLLLAVLSMKSFNWADYRALLRFGLALRKENPAIKGETVATFCQRLQQPPALQNLMWFPIAVSALNETPETACAELFVTVLKQAFFAGSQESKIAFPRVPLQELHGTKAIEYIQNHNGRVILGETAVALEMEGKRIAAVWLKSGERIPCEHCISAIPSKPLHDLAIQSGLEKALRIPALGSSPILSVYLWFDHPFTSDEITCLQGCHYEWALFRSNFVREGEHKHFCVCLLVSAARGYQSWKRHDLIQAAIADLHNTYPASRQTHVLSVTVFWEPQATFSPHPMVSCKRPGPLTAIPNLTLAGDWTDTGLPATIEGAVLSGHNCANLFLHH
ncbi:MAG: hydroxysqualene dehydroxylase HpnE [bacterium]|jgi:zeta-carotene desaturase|nr:hydroxysqualene dehydroxylase HpnE [bacterium]